MRKILLFSHKTRPEVINKLVWWFWVFDGGFFLSFQEGVKDSHLSLIWIQIISWIFKILEFVWWQLKNEHFQLPLLVVSVCSNALRNSWQFTGRSNSSWDDFQKPTISCLLHCLHHGVMCSELHRALLLLTCVGQIVKHEWIHVGNWCSEDSMRSTFLRT